MSELVEQVAKELTFAWMKHLGYTDKEISELDTKPHSEYGCDFEGMDWVCTDENGESNHVFYDVLNETSELVMFILENPSLITLVRTHDNNKIADLEAKIARVRELQGYTMEGCYLVKSESIWKSAWNGGYVATTDLEELLFGPTILALDEEGK
jgi:hypothetical protein